MAKKNSRQDSSHIPAKVSLWKNTLSVKIHNSLSQLFKNVNMGALHAPFLRCMYYSQNVLEKPGIYIYVQQ